MTAGGISGKMVGFCRYGRSRGLQIGVSETLDALDACRLGLLPERRALRFGLRSLLCASRDDRELFDRLFRCYWEGEPETRKPPARTPLGRVVRSSSRPALLAMATARREAVPDEEGAATSGASARERLQKTDFSRVPEHDRAELERLAERLWRRMKRRLTRRWVTSSSRGQVHLRRTIRRNVSHGGEPVELCYRSRRPRKPRLVLLLDVSGSMDDYSFFLVRFVHALQRCFRRLDSFAFSTRLTCITPALRARRLDAGLEALSETADAWSSGTRIGECLARFNDEYAGRVLSRRAVVIVLSDGLDTGKPALLGEQLRLIRRRSGKLIWLNPLKGMTGYRPEARGMQAALPWIDVLLPAHNLESLLELERHLTG